MKIWGKARSAVLMAFQNGHSPSDVILYVPEERILFSGDLVFIGGHPFLGDGDPESLLKILQELLRLDFRILVPGHGPVGDRSDLHRMIQYLTMVQDIARKFVDSAKFPKDYDIKQLPLPYRDWDFPQFFRYNLQFVSSLYRKKEVN